MAFSKSSSLATALVGAAGGALALYYMDPAFGKERRERVSSAANDVLNQAREHLQHHIDSLADLAKEQAGKAQQAAAGAVGDAMGPIKDAAAAHISEATAAVSDARKFVSEAWDRAHAAIEEARHRGHRAAAAIRGEDDSHSSAAVPVLLTAVACCAAGAGLMWAFDPDRGSARRAQLSQQARRIVTQTGRRFNRTGRHLRNRMTGYAAVATRNVNGAMASPEPAESQA